MTWAFKWPQWQTLLFRWVCPQDEKKILLQQARKTYRKKWAAKHDYEELKEGVWFDPIKHMLRKKINEDWTDKHRDGLEENCGGEMGAKKVV